MSEVERAGPGLLAAVDASSGPERSGVVLISLILVAAVAN